MAKRLPGPGRLETLRRLLPLPYSKFPAFMAYLTANFGNAAAFELPWRKYAFLNEPALVKDVLVTQQHAFSKSLGTRVLRMLLGDGLLTSEDPKHRQMRRVVQPAFHHDRIAGYARTMAECANDFVEGIRSTEEIDVNAAAIGLTLRIATLTLFGSDESRSSRQVSESLGALMEEFPMMLGPFAGLRNRLPFAGPRRFERARRNLDAIVYDLIARRRREGGDRGDALSMLLAANDAEGMDRSSDEQIRDEVMTLFMAGHETTANLVTWALYLLADHPEADARLGAAARDGDRDYATRVVRETLRLYPPAWILGREAKGDVTLVDGTFIPAGTTVFMAPLVLHRRPDVFPQPDRFDPDRWIGFEPPPFAYIPFGAGARRCIGEEFAWMEGELILSTLARRYRFERTSNARVGTSPLVTLRPAGPVVLRAVPRARVSSELVSPA